MLNRTAVNLCILGACWTGSLPGVSFPRYKAIPGNAGRKTFPNQDPGKAFLFYREIQKDLGKLGSFKFFQKMAKKGFANSQAAVFGFYLQVLDK